MRARPATGCHRGRLVLVAALLVASTVVETKINEEKLVDRWAESIGNELWRLADAVSQPIELLQRYKKMGVRVEHKSGEDIIQKISENVGRMLSRKMDAVKCLYKEAERVSETWMEEFDYNFTYYSAKYSNATDDGVLKVPNVPSNMQHLTFSYQHMYVEPDTHFNNISVNTSFSSVHIPTNVFDRLQRVGETILWSKRLDHVFKHNYRSDPALMWQYFCSTTGVLRQYPAMRWPVGLKKDGRELTDTYDCRVRSWFIEASTCSKDMVILVDNSGSMTGMSNTIAKATVATILSTLSNNDFVAVFNFSDTTNQVVPCFQGKLVQATPENIRKFNVEIETMKPEGVANVTEAFLNAFALLDNYRNESRCGTNMSCNQLIMLVTDGIASNITEVFQEYNWFDNGTIPVRVFTYLLGQEVTKVREIQWMACLNRGYYAHIHTQAEVPEQVLKYIPVVARPLVLHGKVHPVVWTHAYVDISRSENMSPITKDNKFVPEGVDITDEDEIEVKDQTTGNPKNWSDRLLISVSIPVFDRKGNAASVKRAANLLGVVGTDVPLNEIRRLTLPYKLGVNGYAFIVSNNGYVVLHPALKPDYMGELKLNFNSIDLTEVEILDDGRGPREPGDEITEIRRALVNHECGSKLGVKVKLHYDDSRRVNLESRDYYYAPLPLTPFGIAVVLPQYGRYYIKVNKEIEKHRNRNISDYFVGDNWGIHPQWVYCRYHYLEGHEFDTPEDELRHFLAVIGNFSMSDAERFPEQYKAYSFDNSGGGRATDEPGKSCANAYFDQLGSDEYEPDCGSDNLEEEQEDYKRHQNDHYCNKELMELLIMDAYATNDSFNGEFSGRRRDDRSLIADYEVFIRFIATQSGLTRWQRIRDSTAERIDERIREFTSHRRALDEPWYKGAILRNEIDPESISITVPPIKDTESGCNATVTISLGIFPRDAGMRAAAGVLGMQLPMNALFRRFMAIVSEKVPIPGMDCNSNVVDCYLIDQNGYIIVSEAHDHDAGKFFGSLDQTAPIMRALVNEGVYQAVDIYDYLAVCTDIQFESEANGLLKTPFVWAWKLASWFLARLILFAGDLYDLPAILAQEEPEEEPDLYADYVDSEEVDFKKPPKLLKKRYRRPCDMKMTLYIFNETNVNRVFHNRPDSCALPFYAQRVPHTNLLLIVVKTDRSSCYDRMDVLPYEIFPYTADSENATEWPCHKIPLNDLFRRRLEHCFTHHEDENEIETCGGQNGLGPTAFLILAALIGSLLLLSS
ncbi:voltage-dependent calcium channel subunit alpha-2/delta-3 isoform X2 [Copidosoma floridanum]|uniref:voltage-dependent calcium channel subunit alpha-2/delta-3 isoform X2 n=1 Tax=Copidosoma floridanum TaxID=29053 RepID=UPI0006C9CD1B|nr:voltage-dependent calcium channel subunit alpha-2/delta-3 isoform X2 [Copidosoma floridanum]